MSRLIEESAAVIARKEKARRERCRREMKDLGIMENIEELPPSTRSVVADREKVENELGRLGELRVYDTNGELL